MHTVSVELGNPFVGKSTGRVKLFAGTRRMLACSSRLLSRTLSTLRTIGKSLPAHTPVVTSLRSSQTHPIYNVTLSGDAANRVRAFRFLRCCYVRLLRLWPHSAPTLPLSALLPFPTALAIIGCLSLAAGASATTLEPAAAPQPKKAE